MGKSSKRKRERLGARPKAPASRPPAALGAGGGRVRIAALCGALALVTTLAYLDSFRAPFLLDDRPQIKEAQAIRPPPSLTRWLATPRPVVTATLAFDYAVGELEPLGYHATNLVLHVACGIVLFGFARHLLRVSIVRDRYAGAVDPIAAAAAAIFLLHPIQTESVTYVIQRAEILASLGLLGALWAASAATQPGPRALRWLVLIACSALSTLSKPSFAVFPLLFLLYDACLLGGRSLAVLRTRAPLYLLLVALGGLAALFAQQQLAEAGGRSAGFELASVSPGQYLRWQLGVLPYYLRLVLWPDRLCFDCGLRGPWPVVNSVLDERTWLHVLLLLAIGALALGLRRRQPIATFALLGAALVLAPTSSFVPLLDSYVEHRLYLPIAFLAILAASAGFDLARAASARGWLSAAAARRACAAAALLACAALAWRTLERNRAYVDPAVLYEQSVAIAPQNERSQYDLANIYSRRGDKERAIAHYNAAMRVRPDVVRSYVNLGSLYSRHREFARAAEVWEEAAKRAPTLAIVQRNLAHVYLELGQPERALAAAERAVEIAPRDGRNRSALAKARASLPKPDGGEAPAKATP